MADTSRADALLATIIRANVDSAARTSDILIDMAKQDAMKLAAGFLILFDAIDNCQVIDRSLILAQHRVAHLCFTAENALQETGDTSA